MDSSFANITHAGHKRPGQSDSDFSNMVHATISGAVGARKKDEEEKARRWAWLESALASMNRAAHKPSPEESMHNRLMDTLALIEPGMVSAEEFNDMQIRFTHADRLLQRIQDNRRRAMNDDDYDYEHREIA